MASGVVWFVACSPEGDLQTQSRLSGSRCGVDTLHRLCCDRHLDRPEACIWSATLPSLSGVGGGGRVCSIRCGFVVTRSAAHRVWLDCAWNALPLPLL
jgi:hypothetical protein